MSCASDDGDQARGREGCSLLLIRGVAHHLAHSLGILVILLLLIYLLLQPSYDVVISQHFYFCYYLTLTSKSSMSSCRQDLHQTFIIHLIEAL